MLVAAACCPHPPLLVPDAMGQAGWPDADEPGAGSDADEPAVGEVTAASPASMVDAAVRRLRAACYDAVRDLAAAAPDLIVVVGGGEATRTHPGSAAGSLIGLGIPFGTGSGPPVLPLSLTVGGWLAGRCLTSSGRARIELQEVASLWPAAACMSLGRRLASAAPRVAVLAMGDGTARKVLGVPGAPDPAAERYDARVAAALAACDTAALAALDPRHDADFMVAGRPAWQVLAGAADGGAAGGRLTGQLRYDAAPLDVGYFVVSWHLAEPADVELAHSGFATEAARDDHIVGSSDCLARLPAWLAER